MHHFSYALCLSIVRFSRFFIAFIQFLTQAGVAFDLVNPLTVHTLGVLIELGQLFEPAFARTAPALVPHV